MNISDDISKNKSFHKLLIFERKTFCSKIFDQKIKKLFKKTYKPTADRFRTSQHKQNRMPSACENLCVKSLH